MLRAMWRALETESRSFLNGPRRWKRRIQPRNFLRIYAPALDPTRYRPHESGGLESGAWRNQVAAGLEHFPCTYSRRPHSVRRSGSKPLDSSVCSMAELPGWTSALTWLIPRCRAFSSKEVIRLRPTPLFLH